jgi:hypothetical protein
MKYSKQEIAESKAMIEKFAPKGSTIHGVVRDVARSGMSRTIDFYVIVPPDRIQGRAPQARLQYLSGYMATILGYTRTRQGALKVRGCGMDMIFHCVNSLSYAMHGLEGKGDTYKSEQI